MADVQRTRILAALVEAVADVGACRLSVAQIVARAGVSRRTFYELFSGCEECFLTALDDSLERIASEVVPAYESELRWQDRIRAGLCALLALIDEDPALGMLVFVEALAGGPRSLERRSRALACATAAVDRGRAAGRRGPGPSPLTAEGVVGGVSSVIHARLLEPHRRPLVQLASPLMSMIVLPYLGPAATRLELRRPAPRPRQAPARAASEGDLIKGIGMRLTYRTARVLMALAEQPGASNRQIAQLAGIADQGQMSKLLRRLQRLGLTENDRVGVERGAANSWRLTARGEAFVHVIGTGV